VGTHLSCIPVDPSDRRKRRRHAGQRAEVVVGLNSTSRIIFFNFLSFSTASVRLHSIWHYSNL